MGSIGLLGLKWERIWDRVTVTSDELMFCISCSTNWMMCLFLRFNHSRIETRVLRAYWIRFKSSAWLSTFALCTKGIVLNCTWSSFRSTYVRMGVRVAFLFLLTTGRLGITKKYALRILTSDWFSCSVLCTLEYYRSYEICERTNTVRKWVTNLCPPFLGC